MVKALNIALVLTALDRASAPVKGISNAVGGIGKAADIVTAKLGKVQAKLKSMADTSQQFGQRTAIAGAATVGAVAMVMKPFEELEDATTRMELAYTNAQGKASKYFESIRRQTVDLGNQLPGTTKDFTSLATSLKEAAISEQMIANGGLKAAGYLRTIFKENDSKKVAEVVAGSLHAFNLSDDSLEKYIDIMQRAHYAFGMTLEDFKYGLPYIARSYGLINPKGGLSAARNQTIMMGMLKQGGMEGSMIGESIGSFYTTLATREARLEFGKGRRGLMTVAGDILKKYRTNMEVFDKKGAYVGDEALVQKIWQLKAMGATQKEITIIGNSLAGATGQTIFTKIYQQGPEGWARANRALQDQLNLTQKIERLLKTLTNIKEAGMGTVTNLAATVGGALAPSLKTFFDRLNTGTGKLQEWFEKQEKGNTVTWRLTKTILLTTLALGALGIVTGVGALAFSAIAKPITVLISLFRGLTAVVLFFRATQTVGMFGEIITGASPAILWLGKLKTAYMAVTLAARAFMIANPLALPLIAILALVAATQQLIKHWDSLKQPGFWKDLGGWAGTGFGLFGGPKEHLTDATKAREAREASMAKLPVQKTSGGVHTTYAPVINLGGDAATAKQDFAKMLWEHSREIERINQQAAQKQQRKEF